MILTHMGNKRWHTIVVQKVCGQLSFYHFNWVKICNVYIKMFVVKFQFKTKGILIILKYLDEKKCNFNERPQEGAHGLG
jgi:hypothetical protein